MTEFGLLSSRGIIGFSDVNKTIQNTELMARIMDYASDHRSSYNATCRGL